MTENPALEDVLNELLGQARTGDARADLLAAAAVVWDRRGRNTVLGGVILGALHEQEGLSWREVEAATGIPRQTASRWSIPPGQEESA